MAKQTKSAPLRVSLYARASVPLTHGTFDVSVFHNSHDDSESLVFAQGDLSLPQASAVFVRVHSECFTGEVLGSLKCDCKYQLDQALQVINERGQGLVIYLRQEGRGIGLGNKIRAYHLQNQGLDTIAANHALGLPNDVRDFSLAALILKELGVTHIELNTNNPEKIRALRSHGLVIEKVIASLAPLNPHNFGYLRTKHQELGHRLGAIFGGGDTRLGSLGPVLTKN